MYMSVNKIDKPSSKPSIRRLFERLLRGYEQGEALKSWAQLAHFVANALGSHASLAVATGLDRLADLALVLGDKAEHAFARGEATQVARLLGRVDKLHTMGKPRYLKLRKKALGVFKKKVEGRESPYETPAEASADRARTSGDPPPAGSTAAPRFAALRRRRTCRGAARSRARS